MNTNKLSNRKLKLRTISEWQQRFEFHLKDRKPIPWELGAELNEKECKVICNSLRVWQLGETPEGDRRMAVVSDLERAFPLVTIWEILKYLWEILKAGENTHSRDMAHYLALAGVPTLKRHWADTLFRSLRFFSPKVDIWVTPVLMAEVQALVYFKALRKATKSRVLKILCEQILFEEVDHVRFMAEMLAVTHRRRPGFIRQLTYLIHRIMFTVMCLYVWSGHNKVLRLGGYNFSTYWRATWARMGVAWRRMKSESYEWENAQEAQDHLVGNLNPYLAAQKKV